MWEEYGFEYKSLSVLPFVCCILHVSVAIVRVHDWLHTALPLACEGIGEWYHSLECICDRWHKVANFLHCNPSKSSGLVARTHSSYLPLCRDHKCCTTAETVEGLGRTGLTFSDIRTYVHTYVQYMLKYILKGPEWLRTSVGGSFLLALTYVRSSHRTMKLCCLEISVALSRLQQWNFQKSNVSNRLWLVWAKVKNVNVLMWMHFNTTEYLSTTWTFIPSIHASILSNSRLWLKECWRQKCWHSIQPSVVCSLGRWPLMKRCFLWRCSRDCCMRSMRALKYLPLWLKLSLQNTMYSQTSPCGIRGFNFKGEIVWLLWQATYIRRYIAPLKAVTFGFRVTLSCEHPTFGSMQ